MPLDPRYITDLSLEQYFVDKDTGEPLAFGTVEFWQDDNRVVPKLVYELTGAPPNYTYTALPNPITLSSVGTISDINGNNVALYYFPFDALGNIQLYYVVIRNSLGVIQFTREAWPNTTAGANPAATDVGLSNELSNPQFVDINFSLSNPKILNFIGASASTIPIAPRWDLIVHHSATTTVTITRTAVPGVSAYPGNPPYTLTILPGLNVVILTLRQRLDNNPDIFARAVGGQNGFLAASILLAPLTTLTMSYQPNGQPVQVLLNANNVTGAYAEFTNTVQLLPANNPSTGDTGYVDILLNLPIAGASTFSNVQIVGLNSNIQGVTYDQVTTNREIDQLFNYYKPLLQYKPIASFLIGWDFPYNPAQFLGSNIAASAAGANTSRYVWDQTIVFQSANNGPAISRTGGDQFTITATNTTQFALIQYLPAITARDILATRISAMIAAATNKVGGLSGIVSLYFTTDVALPSTAANNSIVATLAANGKPATFNGNWTEVGRSGLGDAAFTIIGPGNELYGLNQWDPLGIGSQTATFFAIVVGFASLTAGEIIAFRSITLVPGDVPTIPSNLTKAETILLCNEFYWSTFEPGIVPAQATGSGLNTFSYITPFAGINRWTMQLNFPVVMNSIPVMTTYSPNLASNLWYNPTGGIDSGAATFFNMGRRGGQIANAQAATDNIGDPLAIHMSADARLGL